MSKSLDLLIPKQRLQADVLAYLGPADIQTFGSIDKGALELVFHTFAEPAQGRCNFCSVPARRRCELCRTSYYCTKLHQRGHWRIHRVSCCVYQALREPLSFPLKRSW